MQFAMRGGRAAVGHLSLHLCSDHHTRSTAAPCCSPHSSLPDAGTEPVIRRLASAVARDAVPDPKGGNNLLGRLFLHLCVDFSYNKVTDACKETSIDGTAKALGTKSPSTFGAAFASLRIKRGFVRVLKRPGLRKEAASTGTTSVLAPVLAHDRRQNKSKGPSKPPNRVDELVKNDANPVYWTGREATKALVVAREHKQVHFACASSFNKWRMCLELDPFENMPPSPELGFTSGTEDAGFSAAAQAA
ncbi:hypothetical protein Trihar35433_10086 [Trichoderma harzianum]|nr:hypothetical protein Trihar35433_10086 [Trichoderma harzianum]